jgi:hypothetical protein
MSEKNFGALFPNDKGGVDVRPDLQGDITIDGVKYRLVGWNKKGRTKDYISLAATIFKEKE